MRYTKEYTVKEWKKFDRIAERENGIDITMQEILLQKYDVILTDYKTKKEKLFQVIDKFSVDNLNKGIDKFNRGVDSFSKAIESSQPKKSKPAKKRKKRTRIKEDDYTFLTNRKVRFF